MGVFRIIYDEFIGFFGIGPWIDMWKSGNYNSLRTLEGILAAIGPLIPLLLVIEFGRSLLYKKFRIENYKVSLVIYVFNRFLSRFISIAAVAYCIGLFEKHALFKTGFVWYFLLYGYIVWEFSHFIYHFLAHKVRLLWCLHSTHHAPATMNLSVTFAHFFFRSPLCGYYPHFHLHPAGCKPPAFIFYHVY
jgi:sterol desaturase/sphingolipid hydroxylase (fatty acid hydroxylase superfamily)